MLPPSQQRVIGQRAYEVCAGRQAWPPFDDISIALETPTVIDLPSKGHADGVQVNFDLLTTRPDETTQYAAGLLYMLRSDGRWRVVMGQDDVDAYIAGRCPATSMIVSGNGQLLAGITPVAR